MKDNSVSLKKKYKGKTKASSVLMALSVVSDVIPMFMVIALIRLYSLGQMTVESILKYGLVVILCQIFKAALYSLSIHKAHDSAYSSLVEIRLDIINWSRKESHDTWLYHDSSKWIWYSDWRKWGYLRNFGILKKRLKNGFYAHNNIFKGAGEATGLFYLYKSCSYS